VFVAFFIGEEKRTMNELDRDIRDSAVMMGLQTGVSAAEVADALIHIAKVFRVNMKQLQEALMIAAPTINDLTMSAEELATALNCMEPCIQETKPEHKLCFNRPRIVHQVSNRKPRHLIKKIIR